MSSELFLFCDDGRYIAGFIFFTGTNFLLTLSACVLCVFFAPTAAGPGIPEIKAYLNGVDTPKMFDATSLIVKVSSIYFLWLGLVKNLHVGADFYSGFDWVRVRFPQWGDFYSENDTQIINLVLSSVLLDFK